MKNPILRIAQEAPGAPPPDLGGGAPGAGGPPPDMGMPPMDPMMGAGMGAPPPPGVPTAGAAAGPTAPILTPLDSAGAILSDFGIDNSLKTMLSNSSRSGSTGEQEIGMLIWRNYGGNSNGGVYPNRVGKRKYDAPLEEPEKLSIVEDGDLRPIQNRWIRLPEGKTLEDLEITLENIQTAVSAISLSTSISSAAQAKAGGGGGPMASITIDKMVRVANYLDRMGLYEFADKMFPK